MATKTKTLPQKEIAKRLSQLPGWKQNAKGSAISKTFRFKDFKQALRFVNKAGKLAEAMNHHPDIALSYGKVRVTLSTHSVGGLTQKDFSFAEMIE